MVSFQCDGCTDVVKKPKLDQHRLRCKASFTCIDCSTTFPTPADWKGHTSCISEEQKYQKSLYKPKQNYHEHDSGFQNGQQQWGKFQGRNGSWNHRAPQWQATGANGTPLGTPNRMSPVATESNTENAPSNGQINNSKKRKADEINGIDPSVKSGDDKTEKKMGTDDLNKKKDRKEKKQKEIKNKEPSMTDQEVSSQKQKKQKKGDEEQEGKVEVDMKNNDKKEKKEMMKKKEKSDKMPRDQKVEKKNEAESAKHDPEASEASEEPEKKKEKRKKSKKSDNITRHSESRQVETKVELGSPVIEESQEVAKRKEKKVKQKETLEHVDISSDSKKRKHGEVETTKKKSKEKGLVSPTALTTSQPSLSTPMDVDDGYAIADEEIRQTFPCFFPDEYIWGKNGKLTEVAITNLVGVLAKIIKQSALPARPSEEITLLLKKNPLFASELAALWKKGGGFWIIRTNPLLQPSQRSPRDK